MVLGRDAKPARWPHGGGGGEGKANFHDCRFIHHVDKASPVLMQACATGEHIKEATITQRKAGKGQQEFLIIKMNDIIITSVHARRQRRQRARSESVALAVRQGRPRVQAAEGRRLARCRHPLQVRPQGQQGRLAPRRLHGRAASCHLARTSRCGTVVLAGGTCSQTEGGRHVASIDCQPMAAPATCSSRSRAPSTGLIKGEAQDEQHKDEIEVLGWSWGMQGEAGSAAAPRPARPPSTSCRSSRGSTAPRRP